jgi:hypothetical protein
MIGYYVHHVGHGHLHRACALAAELERRGESVTGLSSLPKPDGWVGDWQHLSRDDEGVRADRPDAGGRLHWAPVDDPGLRDRMAQVSIWIQRAAPTVVVSDVSVEVALLARLHGVPVASVVLPGTRGDAAHVLGFDISDALVGFWPRSAEHMVRGVPQAVETRIHAVGALSRFPTESPSREAIGAREARERAGLLLLGSGGHAVSDSDVASLRQQAPGWEWRVLGATYGAWTDDPWSAICRADVVVTHAGQNAIAEVAAARRPAVVLPQARPHDEQRATAEVLAGGRWPATVLERWPADGWPDLLDRAASLDGSAWSDWCDGLAAQRFADILLDLGGHS